MRLTFCLIAGILFNFPMCRSQNQTEDGNNHKKTLEKQFAGLLGLTRYHTMDMKAFEGFLDDLKIKDELKSRGFILQDRVLCLACQALVRNIQTNSITVEILGRKICNFYITVNTWTINDFCKELVRINKPILEYIVRHSKILSPEYACSVLLQNEHCYHNHPALKWETEIPAGGPVLHMSGRNNSNGRTTPLKILHLSDFHISQDYEIGGVSDCGYPVCCKRKLGNPIKGTNAGAWGDYNCDVPPWLFVNTLSYINYTHQDLDLVYFTGDIIDHSVWKDSIQDNANEITYAFDKLAESFPNLPILPSHRKSRIYTSKHVCTT
ncbi:putative sphingomyelin phosphodiesterase asm-3 isoform X2 [Sitophilus oryzae]|uniref:Sphingomyelin phosphodiesterase asm-3 isoform X2 n=1 Tax=Sitophilus oryzae TaxID=7048 RepID=A0A6J2YB39_SITOR|nr:putative sphingomyelin phosphodiesterase asm-3 isoform X2 [Sitophilus oryzae]